MLKWFGKSKSREKLLEGAWDDFIDQKEHWKNNVWKTNVFRIEKVPRLHVTVSSLVLSKAW